MYQKQIALYDKLRQELQLVKELCASQFFTTEKCNREKCDKTHVDQIAYPCIHFYMGNCKYSFNCRFAHSIKRIIQRPIPARGVCKKLYDTGNCPEGNRCKNSHDLKEYPCPINSVGKCKFPDLICRYSHDPASKYPSPVICFFFLMGGCNNKECPNIHSVDNFSQYISYERKM